MANAFRIASRVINEVIDAWPNAEYVPPFDLDIHNFGADLSPSREQWTELLNLCFSVSLTTDEGRTPTFRVGFQGPRSSDYAKDISFECEATVSSLAKLAHAVGSAEGLIWVDGSNGVDLRIAGIQSAWSVANSPSRRFYRYPGEPVAVIEVRGPGRLGVLKGARPVCSLGQEGVRITPEHSPFAYAVLGATSEWWQNNSTFLDLTRSVDAQAAVNRLVKRRTVELLSYIVRKIQSLHHGGVLVLMPTHALVPGKQLTPKYKLRNEGMVLNSIFANLLKVDLLRALDLPAHGSVSEEKEGLELQLRSACDGLAGLSGVDGAIVLQGNLDVWGFGVELNCRERPDDRVGRAAMTGTEKLEVLERQSYEGYGTRHRSAFRLCREVPDAVCVVISQDGSTKVVLNRDEQVLYVDSIEHYLW